MASLLVYAAIVGLLEQGTIAFDAPAMAGSQVEIVKFVLIGLAAVIFFVIRFVNGLLLKPKGNEGTSRDARSRQSVAAPELGVLTTAAVVTYGLCEAPAVFGLVLFFLGGNSSDFYLFLLCSLFYFAVYFPKFSQWEEWYREQQGRRRS